MADACSEQIAAAINTKLGTIVGVVACERNRDERFDEVEANYPRLVIYEGDSVINRMFSGEDGYEFPILVQGVALGRGAAVATTVNNLRGKVIAAMFADLTFGGFVRNLEIDEVSQLAPMPIESSNLREFQIAFRVIYATKEGDPFTFTTGG